MHLSRRKFLTVGASALTLASAGLPTLLLPRKKERLGVALMGLGYYSTDVLSPAFPFAKHCYLAGIVTGTTSKIPVWQQKHGIPDKNVYNYANFDQIANNPDIDVVYVVLPPSMHREFVLRAAKAGKHVWCEKPMALTEAECADMIKACSDNKVKLTIGYRMQHEPNTQQIIKFAKEKTYGDIRLVTAAAGYYETRATHWKVNRAMGGGAMFDMGVYPLNAARYAVGREPMAVTAQQHTNRPDMFKNADETTAFQLEFPGGAIANCVTSLGMGMNYLHVAAAAGNYKLEPFQAYSGVQGSTSKGLLLNEPIANQQARQMDDDSLAILNNQPVLVPGEEGLRDIRVVEAIHKAAKTGKRITL